MATAGFFVLLAVWFQTAVPITTFVGIVTFAAFPGISGLAPGATGSTLVNRAKDTSEVGHPKSRKRFSLLKHRNSSAAVHAHASSPSLYKPQDISTSHANNSGNTGVPLSMIQTGTSITDGETPLKAIPGGVKQPISAVGRPSIPTNFKKKQSWWESLGAAGNTLKRVLNTSPSEAITSLTGFSPWTLRHQGKFASIPGKHASVPDLVIPNEPTTKELLKYICVTVAVGVLAVLQIRGGFTHQFKNREEHGKSTQIKSIRRRPFIIELPQGRINSKQTTTND